MNTIWNDNASLAATNREQHATARRNMCLAACDDNLQTVRRLFFHGLPAREVTTLFRAVVGLAAAEVERWDRFEAGGAS